VIIGWVVVKNYLSGHTEFLVLAEQNITWEASAKRATIFKDRELVQSTVENLSDRHRMEIVPVEVHC
jgi:hypothetical protein